MTIEFFERNRSTSILMPSAFSTHKFAGGEAHVEISDDYYYAPNTFNQQIAFVRGGNNDDLFTLAMWADAIHRLDSGCWTILVMPYLPGARADRGTPLGAKVYADFINSLEIDSIVCLDPHSDVAPALYNNLTVVPLAGLKHWLDLSGKYAGVIAPDLGARKRAESVAEVLNVPVYQATKHRDFETRELSDFQCEELPHEGDFLVVDDICDGGRTFIQLADVLLPIKLSNDPALDLWVTHGIFSYNALPKLRSRYREVYTTDSWGAGRDNVMRVFDQLLEYAK